MLDGNDVYCANVGGLSFSKLHVGIADICKIATMMVKLGEWPNVLTCPHFAVSCANVDKKKHGLVTLETQLRANRVPPRVSGQNVCGNGGRIGMLNVWGCQCFVAPWATTRNHGLTTSVGNQIGNPLRTQMAVGYELPTLHLVIAGADCLADGMADLGGSPCGIINTPLRHKQK